MKKIILMAAVMLSSMAAMAQHAVGTFSIQPKVGLNIANVTKGEGTSTRVGLATGAEFEYQAADIVSVSFGALYSMQGCKGDLNGVDATAKLDYINVPILANVYVTKGLAVKLGVQPGFKVNGEWKAEAGNASATMKDDNFKSFDFSIPIGLSYEYSNFVLDARYNFGCTKIYEDSDSKNSVFQITLGYKFAL